MMSRCVIHIYIKYTCIYYIKTHEKSNSLPLFFQLPHIISSLSFLPFSLPLPPPLIYYCLPPIFFFLNLSPSFLPTLSYHILSFLPSSFLLFFLFLYFLLLIHRSRKNPLSQNPLSQNHLSHNPISQTNSTSDTKKERK